MKGLRGGLVAACVALLGTWSCSGQVMVATGGAGGSTSVASHAVSVSSVSSTSTSGGGGAAVGGATSGGGSGGAGGSGCTEGGVMCAGECTTLAADPSNCGACGNVCSFPNAGAECVGGACVMGACNSGWADCNQQSSDGCELDVGDDPMNCGACGSVCLVAHATAACTQGMCTIGTCDSGWVDCNNQVEDGCEANLQNDSNNCGACGNSCAGTSCPCQQGVCGLLCPKGFAHCPGDSLCGCGTMLGTNTNCNFCGDACALPNATSQCQPDTASPPAPYFSCNLVSCNTGWADCDQVAANGCEVDTTTDPANCGKCGNTCAAGQVCAGGTCQ